MSTIAWKFGGWGGRLARRALDERVLVVLAAAASLWRRSKPIVEETFMSMPGPPHSEPPRCPGHTSTSSGERQQLARAASGRCRARPPPCSTARSGRAMSPTNRVSPVSTAHGSGAARGVDQRERGVLGPVAGRVQRAHAHRCRARAPSRRRTARGRSRAAASRWTWIVAPVAAASRPWPETWSAWLCVSRMCSIDTPM